MLRFRVMNKNITTKNMANKCQQSLGERERERGRKSYMHFKNAPSFSSFCKNNLFIWWKKLVI